MSKKIYALAKVGNDTFRGKKANLMLCKPCLLKHIKTYQAKLLLMLNSFFHVLNKQR